MTGMTKRKAEQADEQPESTEEESEAVQMRPGGLTTNEEGEWVVIREPEGGE